MSDEKDEEQVKKHYIYILREREFIRLNEPTYKIGRTQQNPYDRFSSYPKGTEIILYIMVDDSISLEKQVINTFKKIYEHKKGYGNEYFSGNISEMIKTIYSIIFKDEKSSKNNIVNETKKIKEELDLTLEKLKSTEEQLQSSIIKYEKIKKSILELALQTTESSIIKPVPDEIEGEPGFNSIEEPIKKTRKSQDTLKKQVLNKKKTVFIENNLNITLKNMFNYSKITSSNVHILYLINELKNKGINATEKEVIEEVSKLGGQVFEKKVGDESYFAVGITPY